MSNLFQMIIPPTGSNPLTAGGLINATKKVFRFEKNGASMRLYLFPEDSRLIYFETITQFGEAFPADSRYLAVERPAREGRIEDLIDYLLDQLADSHSLCNRMAARQVGAQSVPTGRVGFCFDALHAYLRGG